MYSDNEYKDIYWLYKLANHSEETLIESLFMQDG